MDWSLTFLSLNPTSAASLLTPLSTLLTSLRKLMALHYCVRHRAAKARLTADCDPYRSDRENVNSFSSSELNRDGKSLMSIILHILQGVKLLKKTMLQ